MGDNIELCPINSGATRDVKTYRGRRTFLPVEDYPYEERRKKYGRKRAIAEVVVKGAAPDIADHVLEVTRGSTGVVA